MNKYKAIKKLLGPILVETLRKTTPASSKNKPSKRKIIMNVHKVVIIFHKVSRILLKTSQHLNDIFVIM